MIHQRIMDLFAPAGAFESLSGRSIRYRLEQLGYGRLETFDALIELRNAECLVKIQQDGGTELYRRLGG